MPIASNKLHVDKLLSNVSRKYSNQEYIWDKVAPLVTVKEKTGKYRTFTRNWRIPETQRAKAGLAREWDFDISTASYALEKHSLKGYIADEDTVDYEAGNYKADLTEELTDTIHRRCEYEFCQLITHTTWTQYVSLAATTTWTLDSTSSNPIPTVDTAMSTIMQNSGYTPNYMIISRNGFVTAKNHVSIADRIKYTSIEITPEILKGLFDIQGDMFIAKASYDTSHEGLTDSISYLWPNDYAFVGYRPASPSLYKPSAMYTFIRRKPAVKTWYEQEREATAVEVTCELDPVAVSPLAGYLIKDVA